MGVRRKRVQPLSATTPFSCIYVCLKWISLDVIPGGGGRGGEGAKSGGEVVAEGAGAGTGAGAPAVAARRLAVVVHLVGGRHGRRRRRRRRTGRRRRARSRVGGPAPRRRLHRDMTDIKPGHSSVLSQFFFRALTGLVQLT